MHVPVVAGEPVKEQATVAVLCGQSAISGPHIVVETLRTNACWEDSHVRIRGGFSDYERYG